jgi:hypothetical protein
MPTQIEYIADGSMSAKLDAPETNCLPCDDDASLSEEVFDISVTEIEAVIEPDSIRNDIGWNRWRL